MRLNGKLKYNLFSVSEKYALNRVELKTFNKFDHLSFLPMGNSDDEYEFNNGYPLSTFYWISITLFIICFGILRLIIILLTLLNYFY